MERFIDGKEDNVKKMTDKQKENVFGIFDSLKNSYIPYYFWDAIVCVAAKESGLIPRVEKSYKKTSNERIRNIFASKLGKYDDDKLLTELKNNPVKFFNWIYRGVAGNGGPETGDGYKYRGAGYNQVTGRANFDLMDRLTGWDLVKHPELLRQPQCAADCLVKFFERALKTKRVKDKMVGPDDYIISPGKAVLLMANVNAGTRKTLDSKVVQRAYRHAIEWMPAVIEAHIEWEKQR